MKHVLIKSISSAFIYLCFFIALYLYLCRPAFATNYYVDPENGKDSNNGLSQSFPLETFSFLEKTNLKAGDSIMLANGKEINGSLVLRDVKGSAEEPIVITGYTADKGDINTVPYINARGHRNGIYLENCSHVMLEGIKISANAGSYPEMENERNPIRCGVLLKVTNPGGYENIQLLGLSVKDVFFEEKGFQRGKDEVRSANGTQSYGWGIRCINQTEGAHIKGIRVENCQVQNVAHTGIKFTASHLGISHVIVLNNKVTKTGGPGIQMSRVENALVKGNQVSYSGSKDDSRKWGRGSGFWCWGSKDVLIEHNSFMHANGPGDSAGCHIDFNCNDVVVQYNFSANNAGGFCEILGNNYNCAYRYNVSVNDGHRVKGENRAFQEGKIFWLSGFCGKGKQRKGPFNSYFYNNTIFASKEITTKIAVDKASAGIFIANNIFYIQGESKLVLGDQYTPEKAGESQIKNVVFKNNLYLNVSNWPSDVLIQDTKMIFGNPEFSKIGGLDLKNYIPGNAKLISNKGIPITQIPGDDIGLKIGLNVKEDILGNPISGLPDMGAIELIN